ncbi:Mut7-C RNAse domain-containing protein [Streptomyces sp. LaPpAH-108]|uniref:Mut7-C RNAse domain-containing protein n=1 Tax=Streptomyces sp. LaPpAH-108 TaxID=1155714 RepID=UPI00036EC2E5|nr:Mut7-C RNAse domain-containing protein [Streptomyces sp. LaPpAH-108]
MSTPAIHVEVAPGLRLFLPSARRGAGACEVAVDGVSTLGHLVESLGIPLTEIGTLTADGREVPPSHLPAPGELVTVSPVARPQRVPGAPLRFLLDVHLGTLARRLRLLGVDTAYESLDIGDPALAARSAAERRVLLSRDRGLLRRRELWAGAYVYSTRPEEQLREVLERFGPELRPWTRCTACGGSLRSASAEEVADRLEDGTRRSYDVFAVCGECGRAYWKGAHHAQLEAIVAQAVSFRRS